LTQKIWKKFIRFQTSVVLNQKRKNNPFPKRKSQTRDGLDPITQTRTTIDTNPVQKCFPNVHNISTAPTLTTTFPSTWTASKMMLLSSRYLPSYSPHTANTTSSHANTQCKSRRVPRSRMASIPSSTTPGSMKTGCLLRPIRFNSTLKIEMGWKILIKPMEILVIIRKGMMQKVDLMLLIQTLFIRIQK